MPTAGRPRGDGSLWAMGLNYSLTGVFYNKALAAKIGMTRRRRRSPSSSAAREGQGRRHHADRAVQRRRDRRPAVPAAEPDGCIRPAGPDQQLDLPEAGRDHRHAVQPQAATSTCRSGSRRATSRGRQCDRLATMMSKFIGRHGLLHLQRRLGVGQPRQADGRQGRLLPDAAR